MGLKVPAELLKRVRLQDTTGVTEQNLINNTGAQLPKLAVVMDAGTEQTFPNPILPREGKCFMKA